jgi:hypothetical protein
VTGEHSAAAVIEAEYDRRLAERRRVLAAADHTHVQLSRLRLVLVAALAGFGYFMGVRGSPGLWIDGALLVAFVVAAVVHSRVLRTRTRAGRAVAYYERGLERIRHQWLGRGDGGERYRPASHLYADDLDLFGAGSAFELVGTAQTQPGLDTIAAWLLNPASADEAVARQQSVQELMPKADLREALVLEGDAATADRLSLLREWASTDRRLPAAGWAAVLATSSVLVAAAAWAAATRSMSEGRALAILVIFTIQGGIVWWLRQRVRAVLRAINVPIGQLALLSGVLRTIERESFTSSRLAGIRSALGGTSHPASAEVARLRQLIGLLDSRRNLLFAPVAASLAWATQIACAIEAWRARVGPHVVRWIDAIGEFEALAVMATYATERPDHVFPSFLQSPAVVRATRVAHPLLGAEAVGNDVAIGADHPHVFIVSGSNMSGKSTFLRAIGLNVVLARMGLPVRATTFALSPLAVGSSIRVVDSLAEGRSKFFAEIGRLKMIVDLARAASDGTLFLLDEILAGTNSHDRLRGAEGVIAGLVNLGAIGLVTTHDLALGDVAGRLPVSTVNVHFADEFDGGGLHFDYRLRPGIVRTSNALELMRAVGLDVQ